MCAGRRAFRANVVVDSPNPPVFACRPGALYGREQSPKRGACRDAFHPIAMCADTGPGRNRGPVADPHAQSRLLKVRQLWAAREEIFFASRSCAAPAFVTMFTGRSDRGPSDPRESDEPVEPVPYRRLVISVLRTLVKDLARRKAGMKRSPGLATLWICAAHFPLPKRDSRAEKRAQAAIRSVPCDSSRFAGGLVVRGSCKTAPMGGQRALIVPVVPPPHRQGIEARARQRPGGCRLRPDTVNRTNRPLSPPTSTGDATSVDIMTNFDVAKIVTSWKTNPVITKPPALAVSGGDASEGW